MDFKYIKEPGFIYDIIHLLCMALNKENFISELKRRKINYEEDIAFLENVLNQCGKIPDDILPYFYIEKNSPCFFSTFYIINKKSLDKLKIDDLIIALSDKETLKNNINEFYFGASNRFNDDYIDLIEKADMNQNLKYRLTRLFANISRSSDLVIEVINRLIPILEEIYSGFDGIIKDRLELLNDKNRLKKLYSFYKQEKNKKLTTVISICIISRYMYFAFFDEIEFFLLGEDFIDKIDTQEENKKIDVDIMALGKIISDPTRLKMLDLLKEKDEIYTGEMCDILNMTLTAVFYHLNMMLAEKLLKSRNEGRKVFYSINNEYLDTVSSMFLNLKRITKK